MKKKIIKINIFFFHSLIGEILSDASSSDSYDSEDEYNIILQSDEEGEEISKFSLSKTQN